MTDPVEEGVEQPQSEANLIRPIADVARMIAEKVKQPGESMRTAIDKVRHRMVYAATRGMLNRAPNSWSFYVPEVEAWAKNKWPREFSDVPRFEIIRVVERLALSVSADSQLVPGDLDRCKQELRTAFRRIEELEDLNRHLEKELKSTREEIDRLRPLAQRYENIRHKNRLAASKPRKSAW